MSDRDVRNPHCHAAFWFQVVRRARLQAPQTTVAVALASAGCQTGTEVRVVEIRSQRVCARHVPYAGITEMSDLVAVLNRTENAPLTPPFMLVMQLKKASSPLMWS